MLTQLSIKNYALIDELKVDFNGGFNIITGETGAGKSIILGALALILGNRADPNSLRDNTKKCVVEGVFNVHDYGLSEYFEQNDLDYENISIFRREITPSGKSRAFINDTPVNLKLMQELASHLIDIHSQHQNLELGNHKFQLQLVDVVAGAEKELDSYKKLFYEYNSAKAELHKLKERAEKERSDLDYFEFQFKQLEEAKLMEGEQADLEQKQELLTHAEEIKTALTGLDNLLDGEEQSLLAKLKVGINYLNKIKGFVKEASDLSDRLESTYIELKDISEESANIGESIDFNPQKLEQLNDRLDMIFSLQQKHHVSSIAELLELQGNFERQICNISEFDSDIEKLENRVGKLKESLQEASFVLSSKRQKVFKLIDTKVTGLLTQLGMPHSRFKVVASECRDFTETGKDSVNFLFSANKNGQMDEISKIASGGETSRLMLAVKSLISSKKALPTIIFDEIDAGISGEIALKMGRILQGFSQTTQIINITHLPQIAGRGDSHYFVFKEEREEGAFTSIRKLSAQERILEIAALLGGDNPTASAISAAKELLGKNGYADLNVPK